MPAKSFPSFKHNTPPLKLPHQDNFSSKPPVEIAGLLTIVPLFESTLLSDQSPFHRPTTRKNGVRKAVHLPRTITRISSSGPPFARPRMLILALRNSSTPAPRPSAPSRRPTTSTSRLRRSTRPTRLPSTSSSTLSPRSRPSSAPTAMFSTSASPSRSTVRFDTKRPWTGAAQHGCPTCFEISLRPLT